ncbi:MAG TPA: type II secretion system protein GspG [Stellaceae bacterium]|jgi:hypothetical protein|nr:type II secretion system protein GspG [Stellaceae bacterium]
MTQPPAHAAQPRIGTAAYVIGGLSFIPLIGVPFGLVVIVWSFVSRKAGRLTVGLLGAGGIALTIVLYGALFYFGFVQTGGVYDRLRSQMARPQLDSLVQAIEFYRLQYGGYPDSLQQLEATMPKPSFITIYDPTSIHLGSKPRAFYYERSGTDHYYLRGVGADGEPFTDDDILPDIRLAPDSKVGLLLDKPAR